MTSDQQRASLSEAADRARAAGDLPAALSLLEQLVALDRRELGPLMRLGGVHVELCQHDRALQTFREALALEPGNGDALCMVGVVSNDLGHAADARRYLEQAADLQPATPELHFNLALARFETGDLAAANASLARSFELRRGRPWNADAAGRLARSDVPLPAAQMAINQVKVRHDCEQLEHLLQLGRLPAEFTAVLEQYRELRDDFAAHGGQASALAQFDQQYFDLVARTYKRPLHVSPATAGSMLNDRLDHARLEDAYFERWPHLVVIDDLLSPEGIACIRQFCRESTIWNNPQGEYLGAYFYDGFHSEPLLRLAWELRERFPRIFGGHPLQMMWGYKYGSRLTGIGLHADQAAVNANLWITPDEANEDPEKGGLLVYPHDAPPEWGFTKFNLDARSISEFLQSVGSRPIRVPYRANRIVVFDSDLFHATDELKFRDGYLNRRINITLLYGLRRPPKAA